MIRSPYLILSGAALVAEAIGAEEIIIGVAGNELANRSVEAAIAAEPGLRDGARRPAAGPVHLRGVGALIRGINGKKPMPPGRKALAADKGVDDLPTLLSNASTFAQVAVLALLGPERFAAVGVPEEPGTVLLSVSGSAKHPAVVECPTGIPLGTCSTSARRPPGTACSSAATTACGWTRRRPTRSRLAARGWPRPAAPSARGSCCRSATAPAPWARSPGSRATSPASRPASAVRASSGCPRSPGRWRRSSTARAASRRSTSRGAAATTVNGRGACAHPDGTTRFVLSALEVFTEDLAAHVFHSTCGRPVRGILPLPEGPEQANAKQLVVDWVRCQGHGLCAHLVPELIHLDKTGFPVIMPIPVPPWLEKNAQHAVQMCPALALRLDSDPKKRNAGGDNAGPDPHRRPHRPHQSARHPPVHHGRLAPAT